MQKTSHLLAMVMTMTMAVPSAFAAEVPFTISNIESLEGTLIVALHPSTESLPKPPQGAPSLKLSPNKGSLSGVFHDVPDGQYAMSVIHDIDSDGKLNKGMFGAPKEPFGVSGNKLSAFGPPDYNDAKFIVKGNATPVLMTLKQP